MLNIPQTGVVVLGVWPRHENLTYRLNQGILEFMSKNRPMEWRTGVGPGPQEMWDRYDGFTEWVESRLEALGLNKPLPPPVPPLELIAKYKAAIEAALGSLADRPVATKILEEALL